MAAGNIKGITIEIGGETTGLQKALKGVTSESVGLQKELTQVEKLLKFNPGNAELAAQKQELLSKQVETTSEKLRVLKDAQAQVEAQFAANKITDEQYRAFNREVINTETSLGKLQNQLAYTAQAQQELESKTKQLDTLFKATGTSVEQFSNELGIGLTNAIKNGTASSKQLGTAIEKIGKASLGASADIDKIKQALKTADDGKSLKGIQQDLSNVAKEAQQAGDEVNGFGDKLSDVIGGLVAGGGIAGVVSAALDTSSLNTQIDISFNVPEESKQSVRDAIRGVEAYGIDGEAALEGVRRQWAMNKDASDESNRAVINGAATIAAAYSGIDFTELVQEANEIGGALNISTEEAMGLVNSLLKTGFPPEQLDIIAEYGEQLSIAGYSAEEIQNILNSAVDTKSWNIDNLLDGLKEGKIGLSEFGLEIPKALDDLLAKTNISSKQMKTWGAAVAEGGEGGKQAMVDVTKALAGVEDATLRNELGVQIFGTKWEDQGSKIVDTLLNAENGTADLGQGIKDLATDTEKLNTDPTVQMRQAFSDLKTALEPVFTTIANVVSKIAEWAQNNPQLAATITAIVTAIGILMGIFMALTPIIGAVIAGGTGIAAAIGGIMIPVLAVIAGIGLLVAAGIALYQNWDTIKAKTVEIWNSIVESISSILSAGKDLIVSIFESISAFFAEWGPKILLVLTGPIGLLVALISQNFSQIKSTAISIWDSISSFLSNLWSSLVSKATSIFNNLKNGISTIFSAIQSLASSIWNSLSSGVLNIVNSLVSGIKSGFDLAKNAVQTATNATKTVIQSGWQLVQNIVTNSVNFIKNTVSSIFSSLATVVSTAMTNVKTAIETGWNKAKSFLEGIDLFQIGKDIVSGLIDGIGNMFGKVKSKITELAGLIPDWAKDMLGINSPSRVMADQVGKWIPAGIAEGMLGNQKSIKAAADKLSKAAIFDAQGIFSLKTSGNSLQQSLASAYGSLSSSAQRMMQTNNSNFNKTMNQDYSKTMHNNITITAVNKEDIVRQVERVNRRLAFEFRG